LGNLVRTAILFALLAPAIAWADATFQFRVDAGAADTVLLQIAQQSGSQILFSLDLVRSVKANGLIGEHTVAKALQIALSGTGLKAVLRAGGVITIARDPDSEDTEERQTVTRAIGGLPSLAADAQEPRLGEAIETVVVTGSLIKRTETGSQSVTAISVDEIALRGATNASEILDAVAQNLPLEVSNTFPAAGTAMASYASLRSLGSESTLVLFGGRRIVNSPYLNKAVDLNTVPTALVRQVDVLSDGASSIYGSDAIAGVINFVTRDEMQGLELSANTLQPEAVGGESYSGSATMGFGSLAADGWNFYVGGTWRERKGIHMLDRRFADTYYLPEHNVDRTGAQTFPANLVQTNTPPTPVLLANPYFPGCAPPQAIRVGSLCRHDLAAEVNAQNPERQVSALTKLTGRFGEHEASLEYWWAQSTINSRITAQPISNLSITPASPYYPGNGITPAVPGLDTARPAQLEMRLNPMGLRETESISDTDRILAELEGEAAGWNYQLYALHSTSRVSIDALDGIVSTQGLTDGIAGANGAPFLNPFGAQSAAGTQYLRDIQIHGTMQSAEGTLTMGGLQLDRKLFELPAGSVAAALALEYGTEEAEFRNNPGLLVVPATITGFAATAQDVKADRDRYSATAEVIVPIVQRLEADVSVRYDHYDDFGGTVNPKVLLTWQAIDGVLNLHGSYNTGFRAPTLFELFRPQQIGGNTPKHNDPILCPGGVVNTAIGGIALRDCNVQFNGLLGANPHLDPVESEAYVVGLDWHVMDRLAVGLDYWEYEVDKTLGVLATTAIFGDLDRFGSSIVRCNEAAPEFFVATGCVAGAPGNPIAYINQFSENIGKIKTAGVDFTLNWSHDLGPGTLSLEYRGTYIDEYEFQRFPGDVFISKLGVFIDGSPVIRYSHYATLAWNQGAWGAQLQNRHLGGYVDYNNGLGRDRSYPFYNEVDYYSVWNLAFSYKPSDTWRVTALIKNVFDEEPPFTNRLAGLGTGYDERFTDPTGRAYSLTFSVSFRSLGELF
jgi:iron complex outermembrane receptor protein